MKAAMLMSVCLLAGCAGGTSRREFQLTADQMNGAWGAVMAREQRQALEEGTEPFWLPPPPLSAARCRWIEPGHSARCRYRVSGGLQRPGREPRWTEDAHILYLTDMGWDFAG